MSENTIDSHQNEITATQRNAAHTLRSHNLALPGLFILEAGLFLDWITTIIAAGYAGGFEANPYAAPLLQFHMIPWSLLHVVAMTTIPYYIIRLHNRVSERRLDLVLNAALVLGVFLTSIAVNNLLGIFRI
jgi:hypothetical protein